MVNTFSGLQLLLSVFLFGILEAKECSFWLSMDDCSGFTNCFWLSSSGECNAMAEWSRVGNKASECDNQKNMFQCYEHTNCFWRAQQGSCEDMKNWSHQSGQTIDPTLRACGFWTNDQDCWAIEKCFWDPRDAICKRLIGKDPIIPQAEVFPTDNLANGPFPAPANDYSPGLAASGAGGMYPNPLPLQGENIYQPGQFGRDTGVMNEFAIQNSDFPTNMPSVVPTAFWEPMNRCESLSNRKSCAYGDGCIWDSRNHRCLQIEGDCTSLSSQGLCAHNPECLWSDEERICQNPCSQIDSESKCAYSEECFWDYNANVCLPTNIRCDQLSSPTFCAHNPDCYWHEALDACKSFFSGCEQMDNDAICGMNDHCLWSDESQTCESLSPDSTPAPMINCEDIIAVDICNISNATETNMPCLWDERQDKCTEYKFDCEDYTTAVTCNAASFRDIECIWVGGDCDENKEKNKHRGLLKSFHLGNLNSQNSTPNLVLFMILGSAFLLGLIFGGTFFWCRSKTEEQQMEIEPDFNYHLETDMVSFSIV